MKKKYPLFLGILLVVSMVFINVQGVYAAPTSAYLSMTRYEQEKSNWCWAATAQMLGKYYGKSYTQSQISTYVKGNSTNNATAMLAELTYAIKYATGKNWIVTTAATFDNIKGYIGDDSMPLGIRMQWLSEGGHYLVMCGYNGSTSKVTLIDPAVGCLTKSYNYDDLINEAKIESGTGYYSNTWVIN